VKLCQFPFGIDRVPWLQLPIVNALHDGSLDLLICGHSVWAAIRHELPSDFQVINVDFLTSPMTGKLTSFTFPACAIEQHKPDK
jgi:hypothetical protein